MALVRYDLLIGVARVDGGLEYLDALVGELGAAQPPYKLLGLAREHRAAYNLYAAPVFRIFK